MNYTIHELDGRFSYNKFFKYYIGFPQRMSNRSGPLNFTRAQKWFSETYGWSAEIRQWADIREWSIFSKGALSSAPGGWARSIKDDEIPEECNRLWSWSNSYSDLRIYVRSNKELAFFQLKFPLDQ